LISKYGGYLRFYLESEIVTHIEMTYYGDRLKDSNLWFGFDCGHPRDFMPFFTSCDSSRITEYYKNIEYVKNECKKVATQLHNMVKEKTYEK
jgi:hypothetical protein